MDVDTRLLRSCAAVAREGGVTRAAERLFISQPALTKQIKQLERLLGVTLFTRSKAGMALTEPGRALVERVPGLLEDWDAAVRACRLAERAAARVLRVGFIASAANEATPDIIAEFRRLRPDWRVEMRQTTWSEPTAGLDEGRVDVALLRLPLPEPERFRITELFAEPRWVALAEGHPLASREEIAFAELRDEPFVAAPAETGPWRDYWLAVEEREGRPPRVGAVTDQSDDWLSAIANGYGIALAPESSRRFYARPGVVYRPVSGVGPSTVGVAWTRASDEDPVVRDFVRCCVALARR